MVNRSGPRRDHESRTRYTVDMSVEQQILELCRRASAAAPRLASTTAADRDRALAAMADAIRARRRQIERANAADLGAARTGGMGPALLDRLMLDAPRIESMAAGLGDVAQLPDPIGQELSVTRR